jgi:hypothetical protein
MISISLFPLSDHCWANETSVQHLEPKIAMTDGKRPHWRHRHRCKDNIKIDFKEMRCEILNCIQVIKDSLHKNKGTKRSGFLMTFPSSLKITLPMCWHMLYDACV